MSDMMEQLRKMYALKGEGKCPLCGKDVKNEKYKDEVSAREAKITGYCQKCMDHVFDEMLAEDDD
jgi:C4-type Zn-finger protein